MSSKSVSSVCFSSDSLEQNSVDGSDLTDSIRYQDEDLSTTDEFGVKLSADTYYYLNNAIGGVKAQESERMELRELKLQILRQQEKIDALSTNLSECLDVIEVHEKEKAVMIDELDIAIVMPKEKQAKLRGWFPKGSNSKGGGSMQMLIDELGKIMADNSRLQTLLDVMRKSFQSHVKEGRQSKDEDTQTIKAMQQEIDFLKHQLSAPNKMLRGSLSISKTSLDSSYTNFSVGNQDDLQLRSSLHSIPELDRQPFGISGDNWTIEGEDIEASFQERRASRRGSIPPLVNVDKEIESLLRATPPTRSKSAVVDLRDYSETPRRKSVAARMVDTRLTQSLTEVPRKSSVPLLVDFDETRRLKAKAHRRGSWIW